MIVYRDFLKARLGNQLFFVASTMGIAKRNNTTYSFSSDLGHSGLDYKMLFEHSIPKTNYVPEKKYHQEGYGYYDVDITDDVELIGYFQSEKFFKHCENEVRHQFKFKKEIVDSVLNQYPEITKSASLHIRRGDYVNQPNHHPLMPLEYYNEFLNNHKDEYDKIFVFTDDIDWAKETYQGEKYIFPYFNENNDLYSFVLLSQSKTTVIANSTYSWWAAWLNDNKDKKIYCPPHNKWFGSMYNSLETKDILPKEWNIINF
jgi:hypothetical protein